MPNGKGNFGMLELFRTTDPEKEAYVNVEETPSAVYVDHHEI